MEGKARTSGITVSSPNQKSGWSPILLWLRKQKLCSIGHLPRSQTVLKGMVLDLFSNTYVLTDSIEGGFFLRKKPLCGVVSVYSYWRTAIACVAGRGKGCGASTHRIPALGRRDRAGIPPCGTRGIAGTLTSKPIGIVFLSGHTIRHSRKMAISQMSVNSWCERGDSNPHGLLRQILSLVRLPIPPLSHPLSIYHGGGQASG